MRFSLLACAALFLLSCAREKATPAGPLPPTSYDPMSAPVQQQSITLSLQDSSRSREIPIRVYLPEGKDPVPVILFSHGLGGSRDNNSYLGKHWASRGYVVVFMQHIGSDESVWQNATGRERITALKKAANAENFMLRVQDVTAVLDALQQYNTNSSHQLFGRMDLNHVGMSGHSFGAVTTQAVSGQSFMGKKTQESRIKAALAMSPSTPKQGRASSAFGSVDIPWMLMTGTEDDSPIGDTSPEDRMNVYPNLPNTIDKYELVLFGAEHSAFSEKSLRMDRKERNPNHHKAILALSSAFWDAYLKQDKEALTWIKGVWPRGVLEEKDRWQSNQ
jgi:predicted dienelactone hydrolase